MTEVLVGKEYGVSAQKVSLVKLFINHLGHGRKLNICSALVNSACA